MLGNGLVSIALLTIHSECHKFSLFWLAFSEDVADIFLLKVEQSFEVIVMVINKKKQTTNAFVYL